MRLRPLLDIQITPAQLGLDIASGSMRLQQNHANMELQQPQAEMRVQNPSGRLQIDNSAVRQELGIGSQLVSARERVAASIRQAQQGAARRAQEGDRMMRQPNVIGTIAAQTNAASAHVETNIGLLPRSRPSITYTGDPLPQINAKAQAPRLQVTANPIQLDSTHAAVNSYLQQRDSIKIDYIGPREIWA